jgi:hypothetical protein
MATLIYQDVNLCSQRPISFDSTHFIYGAHFIPLLFSTNCYVGPTLVCLRVAHSKSCDIGFH